ncbi:hypothetical protein H1Q63_10375 [Desmonostoc muscorum CCALA 125]|nr:hypothetical protein [Desmonostoc muscorum CCALA 125]
MWQRDKEGRRHRDAGRRREVGAPASGDLSFGGRGEEVKVLGITSLKSPEALKVLAVVFVEYPE